VKKPKLQAQLDLAEEHAKRLAEPKCRDKGLLIFGSTGVGKSHVLKRGIGRHILLQDSTKVGLLDTLREHPKATVLSDDNDGMWTDIATLNVLKAALAEQNARVLHVNRASLRAGSHDIIFAGRFASASNHEPAKLSAKYVAHFEAIASRATVINLTRMPTDLLDFVDWRVCECDHFRCEQFWLDTGITSLGLAAAQDVLDFVHQYAWRLPSIDLRQLNRIAVERKRYPEGWTDRCIATLRDHAVVEGRPPPPPFVQRWTERRRSTRQASATTHSALVHATQRGAEVARTTDILSTNRPFGESSERAVRLPKPAASQSARHGAEGGDDHVLPIHVSEELPSGMLPEASVGQGAAVGTWAPLGAPAAEADKLNPTVPPQTSMLPAAPPPSPEQEQELPQRADQAAPPASAEPVLRIAMSPNDPEPGSHGSATVTALPSAVASQVSVLPSDVPAETPLRLKARELDSKPLQPLTAADAARMKNDVAAWEEKTHTAGPVARILGRTEDVLMARAYRWQFAMEVAKVCAALEAEGDIAHVYRVRSAKWWCAIGAASLISIVKAAKKQVALQNRKTAGKNDGKVGDDE
jgi:hypothetical protein